MFLLNREGLDLVPKSWLGWKLLSISLVAQTSNRALQVEALDERGRDRERQTPMPFLT